MRATLFSILNLLNLLIIFEHLGLVGPTLHLARRYGSPFATARRSPGFEKNRPDS